MRGRRAGRAAEAAWRPGAGAGDGFAAAMAAMGIRSNRPARLAVAVSGGPDSSGTALLPSLGRRAALVDILALIVDPTRCRRERGRGKRGTADRLARRGIPTKS